jgi:hypothetical protein
MNKEWTECGVMEEYRADNDLDNARLHVRIVTCKNFPSTLKQESKCVGIEVSHLKCG